MLPKHLWDLHSTLKDSTIQGLENIKIHESEKIHLQFKNMYSKEKKKKERSETESGKFWMYHVSRSIKKYSEIWLFNSIIWESEVIF